MDRVLMLGASPKSKERLRIGDELALLQERLPIKSNRMASLAAESTARFGPEALTPLLTSSGFDILHIVGHGTRHAFFAHAKVDGQDVAITPKLFVNALRQRREPVALVVLCACFSAEWAQAFLEVAHAVVAMPAETYELSAREFGASLYENLYSGMSLNQAVDNATLLMRSLGDKTTIPQAFVRDGQSTNEIYLHREPELLARFEGNRPRSKLDGKVRMFFPTVYVANLPDTVASVRLAMDVEPGDGIWEFDLVEKEGGAHEIEYGTWGDAQVWALIDLGSQQRAIRSTVVKMLKRHYQLVGGPVSKDVQAAMASIARDGKPLSPSRPAPGTLIPRKLPARKPSIK
jgi:hypothetical protein